MTNVDLNHWTYLCTCFLSDETQWLKILSLGSDFSWKSNRYWELKISKTKLLFFLQRTYFCCSLPHLKKKKKNKTKISHSSSRSDILTSKPLPLLQNIFRILATTYCLYGAYPGRSAIMPHLGYYNSLLIGLLAS